ncbi:hypothetical protein E1A91_D02G102100v1 [Gossypium mustelinum]|uniref:Uncharacterized protein n=1 Tax=Gossypium mustelinum TaxID=34275 RepID=A0A5D2VTU1_GOSMU|nr:hypothetical protein E1A91_D02G102100v1 [Gossypium mustelinum]
MRDISYHYSQRLLITVKIISWDDKINYTVQMGLRFCRHVIGCFRFKYWIILLTLQLPSTFLPYVFCYNLPSSLLYMLSKIEPN